MRGIQVLGLACIAAVSCSAAATDADRSSPKPVPRELYTIHVEGAGGLSASWLADGVGDSTHDPLAYLHAPVCLETRGCSTAAADVSGSSRRYSDALSLGTYGPMNVKFTGDQVRVRVSF